MRLVRPTLLLTALLLSSTALLAQVPDPSGHWEGRSQAPGGNLMFQVDLAKNSTGDIIGTLSLPAEHLSGLPLLKVVVSGQTITFGAREDQLFSGTISPDGKSFSGALDVEGFTLAATMTRTGDARIDAAAKSPAIGKNLEGIWHGTLDVDSGLHLVLTMANQPDGTATASIVNLDEGKLTIPVSAITEAASNVTLDLKAIGGSYTGTLNAEGTELAGRFTQGASSAPLTFRRAAGH